MICLSRDSCVKRATSTAFRVLVLCYWLGLADILLLLPPHNLPNLPHLPPPNNDNNITPLETLLNRIPRPKDLGNLLQRPLLGLDKQKIDAGDLEAVPEDKQKVILPAGVGEGDAGGESVVLQRSFVSHLLCEGSAPPGGGEGGRIGLLTYVL